MTFTEAELKAKTVKDLKEIAKELGAPAGGKKDELITAILASQGPAGAEDLDDGLGDVGDDLLDAAAPAAGAAAGNGAAAAAGEAAAGKHASIVFALEKQQTTEAGKKANIAGVKVLSDAERAELRAAKFGLAAKGGTSKPTAGGGSGGISTAGGVGVGLEEEIKKLQRAQKFAKLSEKDEKKLEGLQKKLEAQKLKQQLALDKAELLADTDKLKAREAKFGKVLVSTTNPKDPELLKRRAEKFKTAGKVAAPTSAADDEARKKARLERFAKEKK